jgi:hypothetical protein
MTDEPNQSCQVPGATGQTEGGDGTASSSESSPLKALPPSGLAFWRADPVHRMALIILWQKCILTALLLVAPFLMPQFFKSTSSFERRFNHWDSEHYLNLARDGYTAGTGLCAFYPLWPICIRIGTFLTGGDYILSGYLLGNTFSLVGFLLFFRLVWERHGLEVANRATVIFLLFPGSIFFFFPYTESLFLLVLMILLVCLSHAHHKGAAFAAFLLPMARAIGIFILPFIMWELWRKKAPFRNYWICVMPLLGYALYFAIMHFQTGNALEGFQAQKQFPAQPSIARIADPMGFLERFAEVSWEHNSLRSWVDRLFFLIFIYSLYAIFRMDSGYGIYAICSGLIPALSNILMSYSRFVCLVFPLFIVFGMFMRRRLFWLFCVACAVVQFIFLFRMLIGRWVA